MDRTNSTIQLCEHPAIEFSYFPLSNITTTTIATFISCSWFYVANITTSVGVAQIAITHITNFAVARIASFAFTSRTIGFTSSTSFRQIACRTFYITHIACRTICIATVASFAFTSRTIYIARITHRTIGLTSNTSITNITCGTISLTNITREADIARIARAFDITRVAR